MGKPGVFTRHLPFHSGGPQTAVELCSSYYLRHFGPCQLQSLVIYRLWASLGGKTSVFVTCHLPSHNGGPQTVPSSCVRLANYDVLGCFSSKASLFTGFWLAWVGKPRFFYPIAVVEATSAFYSLLVWLKLSDLRTGSSTKHCHSKSQ